MRRLDESPIDPEIAASLDAIDATLAGEPVDPQYAELAELALLLATERPQLEDEFARSLDQRVERRFARAPQQRTRSTRRRWWSTRSTRRRWWAPLGASVTALAAAVAVVVVLANSGSGGPSSGFSAGATNAGPATVTSSASASSAASDAGSAASSASAASAPSTRSAAPSPSPSPSPQLPPNGRKVVQSAQLSLSSAPNRVDDVSQEVFNVIGFEHGIVNSSEVTSTGNPSGYAQFQLSVPSGSLADTMTRLSELQYANVVSRTDASQDVNDQYGNDVRRLNDDKATRDSLLKQLGSAVAQQQIDSIHAQLKNVDGSIAGDEAAVSALNNQVNFSKVQVTVQADATPAAVAHSNSFTIGKAAHDAGRVLTVVAGGALIALAVLVPIGLLVAIAWWIAAAVRRRRREHALDMA
jgi:Domain of unknown function (DUF4349)